MSFLFRKRQDEPKSLGGRLVKESYKKKGERASQIDGYDKIAEDDNNVAYKNKDGKYKIAIAGSNNMNDALTDAKLFFGANIADTDRYKQSRDFIKNVAGEDRANVELFGHSLSGTIVNELQKQNPQFESTAYNPYIVSSSQLSNKTKNKRTYSDVASLIGSGHSSMENQTEGSGFDVIASHSINNFKKGGKIGSVSTSSTTKRKYLSN